MKITLVRSTPGQVECLQVDLPEGSRIQDALAAAGWAGQGASGCGLWGKVQPADRVLREGDRVELYRPLVADPKTARRRRLAT